MMRGRTWCAMLAVALILDACATQSELLNQSAPMAMHTAVVRGKFEMNCPEATAEILSQEVVEPAIQRPMLGGVQRLEYTVGVSGCGARKTFVVICPEGGEGCFAAGPGPFTRDE